MRLTIVVFCMLPLTAAAQDILNATQAVQARLEPGKKNSYNLELKKNDYIELLTQQQDVDIVLSLLGPDGKELQNVNFLGVGGTELLTHVADSDGQYRLEIRGASQGSAGSYVLNLTAQRAATPHDREVADADVRLRNTTEETNQSAEALEALAVVFHGLGVGRREAQALFRAGVHRQRRRQLREAVADYERADAIFQSAPDLAGRGLTLQGLGAAYSSLSQREKAISYYNQALAIRREILDRAGESETLNDLGIAHRSLSEYDKAIVYFERAFTIAREIRNRGLEGGPLNNLGTCYYLLSQYEKAITYYQQALVIRRESKDRTREANTLENIASAYSSISQYEKAISFHDQALMAMREAKDRAGEAAILNNIGIAYSSLNQYEKAIGYYQEALAIRREIQDRGGEAQPLNNLGLAYSSLRRYDEAIKCYEQALAINREVKDRAGEETTLNNFGMAYNALADYQKATSYFDQALPITREIRDRTGEGEVLDSLGLAYRSLGQYEKAVSYFEQALLIGREVKDRAQEVETLSDLMRTCILLKQSRLAIFYGKQAINVIQSIRSEIRGLKKESQSAFIEGNKDHYRVLANVLVSQGRLIEAQQVLNLLKEQEFFNYVRRDERSAGPSGRADMTQDESQWAQRYRAVSETLVAKGVQIEELEGRFRKQPALMDDPLLKEQHAALLKDLQSGNLAFQQYLRERNQYFAASREGLAASIDLRDVEAFRSDLAELGHGAVAIYTLVTSDRYIAILVTSRLQRAYESETGLAELSRKIMAFREAIQNRRSDARELAEELYKVLIPPALTRDLEQARAETLMWSLDGPLRYVPIAALHDGKQYLLEKYRLAVITPASNARLKAPPKTTWRVAAFGVSRAHEGFSPLPSVKAELAWVVRENSREPGVLNGTRLLDDKFTRDAFDRELIKGYPVIHIASHFSFKPGDETRSFLLLGDGGQFSLAELKSADMIFAGVDLLTLSACSTGLGDIRTSDGSEVESFGVLAQRKGAKAIVASLWPVADVSTALLMRELYRIRQMNPALTKLDALREAQLEFLHGKLTSSSAILRSRGVTLVPDAQLSSADFRHPYFWAPFFVMGNWL